MLLLKTCFYLKNFFLLQLKEMSFIPCPCTQLLIIFSLFPQMISAAVISPSRALELNTDSFKNHQHRIRCQEEKPTLVSMLEEVFSL